MDQQFKLPCGVKIKNRLVKSAMTEGLADPLTNKPNEKHYKLYEKWSNSGAAILISGNVMIDHRYMECPNNVVVENNSVFKELCEWVKAVKKMEKMLHYGCK